MINAHIKVMDKLLEDVLDEIYFSKVVELESKIIYVSYLWNTRIIVDNVKKQVVFIVDENGHSIKWVAKTITEIQNILNIIIWNIQLCY